jgi:hypothetical protein
VAPEAFAPVEWQGFQLLRPSRRPRTALVLAGYFPAVASFSAKDDPFCISTILSGENDK